MKYYSDFLGKSRADNLLNDIEKITDWKDFNRNNSHMKEFYGDLRRLTVLRQYLQSKNFIHWIEEETGIRGLVVDCFGIGEGVSLMESGDLLDPHIDFNWNDRIKMNRAVSLLIYLGDCEGGEFHVWDENKKTILFEKEPTHNSAIIFSHSERRSHGVKPIITGKRYAIRQFYYKSEAVCENAHQSLYWYNPSKKMVTNSVEIC